MRVISAIALVLCSFLLLQPVGGQDARKGKEVTLKGKITCAKCGLDVESECMTVIVVKVDKKDVIYYFDKNGHEKHHDEICSATKPGSVTGVISEKNKKKIITVKSVTFD